MASRTHLPTGLPGASRRARPAGLPLSLLLLLALAGTGCSREQARGGGGFQPPPMPVETAVVSERPLQERFEAVGTMEAGDRITVVSEINARVVRLVFEEGERVGKGDLLVQLDADQLRAEVDRAQALVEQFQVTYERVRTVVEQNAAAPQDLDDARADLRVAEANLALARSRLSKARITAPFAGLVGTRRVSPGAFITAGTPITELASIDTLRVVFSAPERFLGQLRKGARVTVGTPAFPGRSVDGLIKVVEPVLDPTTRSTQVVATVRNPEGLFRPGMSANVSAVLRQYEAAAVVPAEAIFLDQGDSFVYRIESDSTVVRTPVRLGVRLADVVAVEEGLQPGQTIVRTGHQKLFPGAKVLPVSSRTPQEPAS